MCKVRQSSGFNRDLRFSTGGALVNTMKTIPVATYNEQEPAGELKCRLEAAGIPPVILDESKLERFWFMSEPAAAIHVEVRHPDYLRARQFIRKWHQYDGILKLAVVCPACSSPRVEFPQITRKFLMPIVEACLMALHVLPREFYCLDCQYTWPKTKPPKREFDILGFPRDPNLLRPEPYARTQPPGDRQSTPAA